MPLLYYAQNSKFSKSFPHILFAMLKNNNKRSCDENFHFVTAPVFANSNSPNFGEKTIDKQVKMRYNVFKMKGRYEIWATQNTANLSVYCE